MGFLSLLTCDQKVTYYAIMSDDNKVFEALSDPTRRHLLDRLFERDGRTLTELLAGFEMTRFGIMKHLRVLEDAGLITSRKEGRQKLHYLNPLPIQTIYERYVHKFSQQHIATLTALKAALEGGEHGMSSAESRQVYQVFIKATPEMIWKAITTPEFTRQYFHQAAIEVTKDHYISHGPNGDVWGDAEVIEFDPPRRLVHGWQSLYDPEMAQEQPSRVTWEIQPGEAGVCILTVIHDQLEGAPKTAESVSGAGWMYVLSGLKTLLETGACLA
jgi:uncharacterized protein YndB with AHSA1/START domain/DNA-binding transcriptional ArsR family regulator